MDADYHRRGVAAGIGSMEVVVACCSTAPVDGEAVALKLAGAIRMLAATATIKEYAAARAAEPSRDGTAGGTGSAILRGRRSAYSSAMNGYL